MTSGHQVMLSMAIAVGVVEQNASEDIGKSKDSIMMGNPLCLLRVFFDGVGNDTNTVT